MTERKARLQVLTQVIELKIAEQGGGLRSRQVKAVIAVLGDLLLDLQDRVASLEYPNG